MMYPFNRRAFLNAVASIPFIGAIPRKYNRGRFREIFRGIGDRPMMVLYHDWPTAYTILNHLDTSDVIGLEISMPGSEILPKPNKKCIAFQQNRPGATGIDALSAGAHNYAKFCNLILVQDPCKYGTFTVLKSRYTKYGEILNVFTPEKPDSTISNV